MVGILNQWLNAVEPKSRFQARMGETYRLWNRYGANPVAVLALGIILLMVVIALAVPFFTLADPLQQSLNGRLAPPSSSHWFGTDSMGRDIFSRILWGTRPTFFIVFVVIFITGPVGIFVGSAAGLFGGFIDRALMRVCDIFIAFPRLILALAIAAVLGAGMWTAIWAISLTAWTPYARVARAEAITFRQSEFVQAARMLGCSPFKLLWRHIMPLCVPSMIVRMALDAPGIILVVSGLGFLGVGIQPPTPEWGAIVAEGRSVIFEAWWVSTLPDIAILVAGLAFNISGDALRDLLAPGEE